MDKTGDLYARLVAINQEAFDAAHYETAYHALAAALHYAQDTQDAQQLEEITRIASEQLEYINTHAPDNAMATSAAVTRQGVDLLRSLAHVASARARMIRHSEHRADASQPVDSESTV
jgi:methionyl-tRNA synthetase